MATTYLTLANSVIARVNEVQLTSSNFSDARGVQIQCKNSVNEAIRWINQKEFNWPFNHSTKTQTLTPGIASYSIPTDAKTVDYDTFRMVRDDDLGIGGDNLNILTYYEYVQRFIEEEDAVKTTALNGSHTDSVTTITVDSTSGFDSSGTIYINGEVITYTGTSSTTFTGATRGAGSTTAAAHSNDDTVAQFGSGGIPTHIVRKLDNNFALYPYPTKQASLKYDYFTFTADLDAHGDTIAIPDRFVPVILDGATAFVYQYRGDAQQYTLNFNRFEQGIKNMQSLLANRMDYMRSTAIIRPKATFNLAAVGSG